MNSTVPVPSSNNVLPMPTVVENGREYSLTAWLCRRICRRCDPIDTLALTCFIAPQVIFTSISIWFGVLAAEDPSSDKFSSRVAISAASATAEAVVMCACYFFYRR